MQVTTGWQAQGEGRQRAAAAPATTTKPPTLPSRDSCAWGTAAAQHSTAQHSTAQHSTAVLSQHQPQPSPVLACVSLLEAKKKVRSSRPERKLAPNVPHPTSAACQSGK